MRCQPLNLPHVCRFSQSGPAAACGALLLMLLCSPPVTAHERAAPPHVTDMVAKAQALLEVLSEELREQATFPFDSDERLNWHFIPKERLGVRIKDMDLSQRRAAYALLQSGLSSQGYLKATTIMGLEQILRELEKDRPGTEERRDPEKYWIAIFGTPAVDHPWGWRIEGHHLSLNFSSAAGKIIASTPLFLGANPAEVRTGPRQGQRALAAEEDLARQLMASFNQQFRRQAMLAAEAPDDVYTAPGEPIDLGQPAGVAFSEMKPRQQKLLVQLMTQVANTLRGELAAAELKQIRDAGHDNIHFAWAGSLERGEGHYYRVHGPTFIIEYDNTQNDANHIHVVWHSLTDDFGLDFLHQHYQDGSHQRNR